MSDGYHGIGGGGDSIKNLDGVINNSNNNN